MNDSNPLAWDETTAGSVLKIVGCYVTKHSQPDCPAPLSPEARGEIQSRVMFDLMTGGDIPDDIPLLRHVFRRCRLWRMRGWNGDCELDRDRQRAARARERNEEQTPGTEAYNRSIGKDSYRGYSDDSRQPTPLAQLIAIETATMEGLRYVSDRQRKARRRAVKGNRIVKVTAVPGEIVGRMAIVASGRVLWFPGAFQRFTYREEVVGERGRWNIGKRAFEPFTGHTGTVPNRAIGKSRTDAVGTDAVGVAMATMAILGRTRRKAFRPATLPMAGVPATAGDGTEWRAAGERCEWRNARG